MEIAAEQVAARHVADQEYSRRRRSDAAVRSTENANLKCHHQESRQRLAADYYEAALIYVSVDTSYVTIPDCGTLSAQCQYCSAKFFIGERVSKSSTRSPKFGLCCGAGKIKLWAVPDMPEPLAHLLTDMTTRSRQFRRDIRCYNCALCLASMQANEVTFPSGPSVFKVHRKVYRFMGPMRYADGQQPKCLQTFFVHIQLSKWFLYVILY